MNISKVIFEKLKKMLKIADFASFGPKYLSPQIFPRYAICGNKLEVYRVSQKKVAIAFKIRNFSLNELKI